MNIYQEYDYPIFYYEYVSFEELFKAYEDCKKRKRSTHNCEAFEINECINLYNLWIELNSFEYIIGKSTVFIYHEPCSNHYREIFAADFRDRIIQHLIVNRIIDIFEYIWEDHSFSCRKDKGTDYGVKCFKEDIKEISENYTLDDIYVVGLDIYSFFASLDKLKMFEYISSIIKENYKKLKIYSKENIDKKDIIYTIWLLKLILFNDPRKDCIFKQPKSFWKNIPKHKSAFYSKKNKYLAVGNITSQLFANIFVSCIDKLLSEKYKLKFGRYVDDIYFIIKGKEMIKIIINDIEFELNKLGLKLQQSKTYIQPYQNGAKFLGKIVKKNRIYILNKTKGKMFKKLKFFEKEFKENGSIIIEDLEYISNVLNSYLGMLVHCNEYKLRKSIITSKEMEAFGKYMYTYPNYNKLSIYQDYLPITNHKKKYVKDLKNLERELP